MAENREFWLEMARLGWDNRIDELGTISLMMRVKRNIAGRIIAQEGGEAWRRDVFLAAKGQIGRVSSVSSDFSSDLSDLSDLTGSARWITH